MRNFTVTSAASSTGGQDITLLKPSTYMNRSGLAVRALADYIKVEPAEILVVHDELDLPAGDARFKLGGGAGGHNGLRDTTTHMGPDYWRLRIGVGHPGDKSQVHRLRAASGAEGRGRKDPRCPSISALQASADAPRAGPGTRHERAAQQEVI